MSPGGGRLRLRPVPSLVGTRLPGQPPQASRCPLRGREEPKGGRETQCALPPLNPADGAQTLRALVPFRSPRLEAGARELSVPLVLNQALRKRSRRIMPQKRNNFQHIYVLCQPAKTFEEESCFRPHGGCSSQLQVEEGRVVLIISQTMCPSRN